MTGLAAALRRVTRGRAVEDLLRRFDIDPRRYWLLVDLFGELTERREMFGHLGRDGTTLRTTALVYGVITGIISLVQVLIGVTPRTYISTFLALTGFLLITILLPETSNSLVNPVEAAVLAHQPINGATYTAAKLSHLLRILASLVPAFNLLPALAGVMLPGNAWTYPFLHLGYAWLLGLLIALCCCALYGWLIHLFPPARLKAVGQAAEAMPLLLVFVAGNVSRIVRALDVKFKLGHYDLPPAVWRTVWIAMAAVATGALIFGLRALRGDYLVRVSAIMHGRPSKASAGTKPQRLASMVSRIAGGPGEMPGARAGYEYIRRMAARDWQFRRQMIPLLPAAGLPVILLMREVRNSPFSGTFSAMHVLPHGIGAMTFFICSVLAYGSEFKGAWIFLGVPNTTFHGFVRGVHAFLWCWMIGAPHAIFYGVLAYKWGVVDATIFIAFSLAVSSLYLALSLRTVEGLPFGQPVNTSRGAELLPLMIGSGLVIALVVALQHYLLFHSRALVVGVATATAIGAYFATRSGLHTFEVAIRYHLGQTSQESTMLYKEVV